MGALTAALDGEQAPFSADAVKTAYDRFALYTLLMYTNAVYTQIKQLEQQEEEGEENENRAEVTMKKQIMLDLYRAMIDDLRNTDRAATGDQGRI